MLSNFSMDKEFIASVSHRGENDMFRVAYYLSIVNEIGLLTLS